MEKWYEIQCEGLFSDVKHEQHNKVNQQTQGTNFTIANENEMHSQ